MKENNTYRNNTGDANLLKSLRVNPFILPENYFENLERTTLFRVMLEASLRNGHGGFVVPEGFFKQQQSHIQQQLKLDKRLGQGGFTVPEEYFENTADKILAQTRIPNAQEIESDLPEGYFEQLSGRIIDRIQTEIEELDTTLPAALETGFNTPDHYFESSAEEIMSSAISDSLKSKVSQDGFTVPDRYFHTLSNAILEQSGDPKIISIVSDTKTSKKRSKPKVYAWLGSAAAACAALVFGINLYQNDGSSEVLAHKTMTLHEIPEEEIINYLSSYGDPSDLDYYVEYIDQPEESIEVGAGIAVEDLENYLNYTL
ncbi:MAG: hypothetical protein ACTHZ1_01455 [Sphingobacterium sp.]